MDTMPLPDASLGPLPAYRALVAAGGLAADQAQALAAGAAAGALEPAAWV